MNDLLLRTLIGFAALSCGVMAGVYFTFSAFVMRSLSVLPPDRGIAAMQSINAVILSSSFMPLFFGSTLLSVVLALYGGFANSTVLAWPLVVSGACYALGMFVVTAAGNVPLNEALAAAPADAPSTVALWENYLTQWTRLNHIRTLASAASSALFVYALSA